MGDEGEAPETNGAAALSSLLGEDGQGKALPIEVGAHAAAANPEFSMSGSEAEKQALAATTVGSDSGRLTIHFSTTDTEFASLLQSPLFQSMVR